MAGKVQEFQNDQKMETEIPSVSSEATNQSEKKLKKGTKLVDVSPSGVKGAGKSVKRKRASIDGNAVSLDKESLVTQCNQEFGYLFEYFKELTTPILSVEDGKCSLNNSLIACMLEESNLSFSKLVEVIYEKLKGKEGVTLAYVRGAVLAIGQRMMYGMANADADVLEDESESCLWCWETRDMKLLPTNQRGDLSVRREGRKKIHERISALSALAVQEDEEIHRKNPNKTVMKLGKSLNVEEIRSFVEKKKKKNDASMAEKAAKLKEKETLREDQKEKLQKEKEIEQLQINTEEKHQIKEEAEFKKQLKKQEEEAEKNRRRRERAEAELKEQRSLKKQATIMERFFKTKRNNNNSDSVDKQSATTEQTCDVPCKVVAVSKTTSSMDDVFSRQDSIPLEDLRKLHVDGWHKLSRWNRSIHWGFRRNPKVDLVKELKLHESFSKDGSEKSWVDDSTDIATSASRLLRKKLLQFAKSNRPAYYGTWSKGSFAVGPRHPFQKDPDLNYDVDSDEEWEEEEPGESLSDCDKDTDEECLEGDNSKGEDEEENEDGFLVPDGYLSENEGVQVDSRSDGVIDDAAKNSPSNQSEFESEETRLFLQHQKYLQKVTQQALRKGYPLVISNLMHEKSGRMMGEDISETCKNEQMCLQALCMQAACIGDPNLDIPLNNCPENKDQDVPQSQDQSSVTPSPSTAGISEMDLSEFVSSIRSNSQGINRVLESLQGKFPTTSKSQLRNKVKEISDYVDNRWKVKKEILDRLGLSTSPENVKRKGITTFFSKRCLPPEQDPIVAPDSSLQQCPKTNVLHDGNTQYS